MKKTHQIDYNVGAWNEWMNDQNKVTVAHPTIYSEACELRKSNKHWASVIKVKYLGSRYILPWSKFYFEQANWPESDIELKKKCLLFFYQFFNINNHIWQNLRSSDILNISVNVLYPCFVPAS